MHWGLTLLPVTLPWISSKVRLWFLEGFSAYRKYATWWNSQIASPFPSWCDPCLCLESFQYHCSSTVAGPPPSSLLPLKLACLDFMSWPCKQHISKRKHRQKPSNFFTCSWSGTTRQCTEKHWSAYSLSYLSDRAGGRLPNASQVRSLASSHQWWTWSYLCIIKCQLARCSSKDDKSMLTSPSFSRISMTTHEKEQPVYPVYPSVSALSVPASY